MIIDCNDCNNNRNISVKENKRSFVLKNIAALSVNKVEVDGCYITTGKKCDYLFEIMQKCNGEKPLKVFYVELKGKDIEKAVEQLENSMKYCNNLHKNIPRECHIVASRYPRSTPSSQELKKSFKQRNGVQLFISTNTKEIDLSQSLP